MIAVKRPVISIRKVLNNEKYGGCLIRGRNYLPLASTWVAAHRYSFMFCVVPFVLFVFVLRLVCPMLAVSVDCLFWIGHSLTFIQCLPRHF
jgi:hypothetical protein